MSQQCLPSKACLCDNLGRIVRYLRISITDRCNLCCKYCQSNAQTTYIPHNNILRYEEMLRLIRILHRLGVNKVRLTGGEPLARKGCVEFLATLRREFADLDLRLTSNGTLLEPYVRDLQKFGINAVNISLDTFDAQTFAMLTGQNMLNEVLATVDALLKAKIKVKVNAVALQGITQKSLEEFIYFAKTMAIDVRFIEFMPIGQNTVWSDKLFCPLNEILELASQYVELIQEQVTNEAQGPARMFKIKGSSGRLGFISPLSNHFCHTCNRLRLTSDGNLRLCLYDDREYQLRDLLRDHKTSDSDIAALIQRSMKDKPLGVNLLQARKKDSPVAKRNMSKIGG